jgi:hypothetical protein
MSLSLGSPAFAGMRQEVIVQSSDGMAKGYAAIVGVVLVAIGLLGFVDNPIVGPSRALFPTGAAHNAVHIVTGLIALYVAFGLSGAAQANGVIGFGVFYAVIFIVVLISPTLFGVFDTKVNVADHVLHAGVALVSIALGYMARGAHTASY